MKIKLDPNNYNRHTEDGMQLLENSIKEVGVIESVCIDKDGEVITGNARQKKFEKLGYVPKIITLAENEYPVIATNLSGEKRQKAAIFANTVAQKNINLDLNLIQEIAVENYNIQLEEVGIENYEMFGDDQLFGSGTKDRKDVGIDIKIGEFSFKIIEKDELYPLVEKLKENLLEPCDKKIFIEKIKKICTSVF